MLEPRWRDKVLIRDPVASGTMRAIWGLIIERGLRRTGDTAAGMAWLRRLDGQTRTYALSPALLDAKLARQEGLVTLWDLPDILISRSKGMPFGYVFPRSGTPVIDDAIALVRERGTRTAARLSSTTSGASRPSCWPRSGCSVSRPGATCRPSRVPAWVAQVEQ